MRAIWLESFLFILTFIRYPIHCNDERERLPNGLYKPILDVKRDIENIDLSDTFKQAEPRSASLKITNISIDDILNKNSNVYENPIIVYPDMSIMEVEPNAYGKTKENQFVFRLSKVGTEKTGRYNVIYPHAKISLPQISSEDKNVPAFWVPQGHSIHIPIKPADGEPKFVFTNPITGCTLAVDHFGTHYRVHHVNGGTIDQDYNRKSEEEHGHGMVDALEYPEYGTYINPGNGKTVSTNQAVAFMAYSKTLEKWEIHYQTHEGPIIPHIHEMDRVNEMMTVNYGSRPTEIKKHGKIVLPSEERIRYPNFVLPNEERNRVEPSTTAGPSTSSTRPNRGELILSPLNLMNCFSLKKKRNTNPTGCLINKEDVRDFVELDKDQIKLIDGEKMKIDGGKLLKSLKTNFNEEKNHQLLNLAKRHGIIDDNYKPAIENLYENSGLERSEIKKHIDASFNDFSKSKKVSSNFGLVRKANTAMLLHGIYSTAQTCSKQLDSLACLLGASGMAWGLISSPIEHKLVDKGAAKISKFFFKQDSKLILRSIGAKGALRVLRGAGAALTGGVFDVIDMGIQIYNLVDCSNRPKENRCSKKEIRDSIASLAFDGVSLVSTIACAALAVPGIGLAIGAGILAIQLIYGGISAVKEYHEKFRTTVGEDISIFVRSTLMLDMSNEIKSVDARQTFVNNAAEEMVKILQNENNNISTYAVGLGYILDQNKFIPNGGEIDLGNVKDMTKKVSRVIPNDKIKPNEIEMICLPAPVKKNDALRDFEDESLLNDVASAKYFCDNAMVFKNEARNSDSIVYNLELFNSGSITGSNEQHNLFYIHDSNRDNAIVGDGINEENAWWSDVTDNIVNGLRKDPFHEIVNGPAEEKSSEAIKHYVVDHQLNFPLFNKSDGVEEGLHDGKLSIIIKTATFSLTGEIFSDIKAVGRLFRNDFHIDQINLPNDTYTYGLFVAGGNSTVNRFVFVKHPFTATILGGTNATNIIDCSEKSITATRQIHFDYSYFEDDKFYTIQGISGTYKIIDDFFDEIDDNRNYHYIGPHSIKDIIVCQSNKQTNRLIIDTNGGNPSEFDIIINCQIVLLSPYTKVHGHTENIEFNIFVKTNNFPGYDLESHVRIVQGQSKIKFIESNLLDESTKMIYNPKSKQLKVITNNNRYTVVIHHYGLSGTSNVLFNQNDAVIIPRINVTEPNETEITSFEVVSHCRPPNDDDSVDRYEYCSASIVSAKKFNILKTIHFEDDQKGMIIGSSSRDVILFHKNISFAKGNNGQDTYVVMVNSDPNIIIQNYADDQIVDYVILANPPKTFSQQSESLFLKDDGKTIEIRNYFVSPDYQHLIFTDHDQNFIPSIQSKMFVPFLYVTSARNSFILSSSIDYTEIVINGTQFTLESYADDNNLIIISIDEYNLMSVVIQDYFLHLDKWNKIEWFLYNNGNLFEFKNLLLKTMQPISYKRKTELAYEDIFKEYKIDLQNIIEPEIIHHTDRDRTGLIKLNYISPKDIEVSVDGNSLVFTDMETTNKLLIEMWDVIWHRISIIEFTQPLESIAIRNLNRFGLNDIGEMQKLLEKAGINSMKQREITPLIGTVVKCKISEYGFDRNENTFNCLDFSSMTDQINFVNKFCSNERKEKFDRIENLEEKIDIYVSMLKNQILLNGYSKDELKKCQNVFKLSAVNDKDPRCKVSDDSNLESGYQFGANIGSRIQFSNVPDIIQNDYEMAFQFKTDQPNGVLFYVADSSNSNFVILYLKDGNVFHSINCGSGTANIISHQKLNDNQWHTVLISREMSKAKLKIDNKNEVLGESVGDKGLKSFQGPYFFGGVDPKQINGPIAVTGIVDPALFSGWIRNIYVGNRFWEDPDEIVQATACSEHLENGAFFTGGYIKLRDRFEVGIETSISFDIKPRAMDGFLLSVHGKNAMLALQLINGTIDFTVDNGAGPITEVYTPARGHSLCDGEWHTIRAIKSNYVITLLVDEEKTVPSIGASESFSTDTTRPLYLGGHPNLLKTRGLKIREPFNGCIRNVKIKDEPEHIKLDMAVGDAGVGGCPTY